ncbi:carboxylesterase family protein [Arthroderma uncinatum]|uniref:carboxylesterase family protein n=1 Tax=Arthroderma uncinatum TaxID=74035 RepID=UPI00144A983E|nr:carboxylesterase family protein [Arthroderma uncinatum]KAF3482583.1 carboxylesterase family protein [Arthroderma uncinatum]
MFTRLFYFGLVAVSTLHAALANEPPGELPILSLPYGRWRAAKYDRAADVYTFRNIRYAVPPTGPLRWTKPVRPKIPEIDIQDGSYDPPCIPGPQPEGFEDPSYEKQRKSASEDCLFLDIYVPGKALRENGSDKLPVIAWIYGGGYTIGSKDQAIEQGIYDGTRLVQHAAGNAIVVTFNYRLSVFGWLAGTTMENEGLPNAGLHDQRAALEWIKDYIHLVGGDRRKVSAWGESAGGGSILSHLIMHEGKTDPLFRRAVALSPGLSFPVDRKGMVEDQFRDYLSKAGCTGKGVACLRAASISKLIQASHNGVGQVGPTPDGRLLKHVFSVEMARGKYWKHLDSLVVSHVFDEGGPFIRSNDTLTSLHSLVQSLFPAYAAEAVSTLADHYNLNKPSYESVKTIGSKLVRDAIFACNIRAIVQGYPQRSYLMQYSPRAATHGADVAAVWYSPALYNVTIPLFAGYQSYLLSHAITNDPNSLRDQALTPPTIAWPRVAGTDKEKLRNVLNVGDTGYQLIADEQVLKSSCDIWQQVLLDATRQGGYL